ncbi:MAG: NAD(P)/FAD-dependent oxidoreductase [Ignavibacteriales bacterium]|nr:NAD(P)/FAD-dependent oxidoreductase [Ignavibacteriales bacterium]
MNTIILGGGFGGLAAAQTLRSLLPNKHTITLISKSSHFLVGAGKTWIVTANRRAAEIMCDLKSLIPRNVDFLQAEVQRISSSKAEVVTSAGTLRVDFLVIALGADLKMSAVPGLAESAYSFYTLDEAVRLGEMLDGFEAGDVVLLIPQTPFKCPPAPYEAAFLLNSMFMNRGIRDRVRLSIHTVEPAPMPTAGVEMSVVIRDLMEKCNIAYYPGNQTKSVDPAKKIILFQNGREVHYDLLIAVPPHEAPRVVREAGLLNQTGWIPVDPKTLKVDAPESAVPIFAVGDVTVLPLPGRYKADAPLVLPKAGVFAASQGVVAAHQIAAAVLGKPSPMDFDGKGFCYIEVGGNKAIKGEGSFFDLPHPVMKRRAPDEAQFRDKLEWVKSWLEGRGVGESHRR